MVARAYQDTTENLLETGLSNLENDLDQIEAIAITVYTTPQFRRPSYLQGELEVIDYYYMIPIVDDFKRHFISMRMIVDCGILYENGFVLTNKRLYFPGEEFYGNYFRQNGIETMEQWIGEMPRGNFKSGFASLNYFHSRERSYEGIGFCINFSGSLYKRAFFFTTLERDYILSRFVTDEVLQEGRVMIYDPDGKILMDSGAGGMGDKKNAIIEMTGARRGIRVAVEIPRRVFTGKLAPFRRIALIFSLIYIAAGAVLSIFFAQQSAKPVREIMKEALDFKARDLEEDPSHFKNDFNYLQHFISRAKWDYETFKTKLKQQEELQRENLFERLLYGLVYSTGTYDSVKSYLPDFPENFRIAAIALPGIEEAPLATHAVRQTMIRDLVETGLPPGGYAHFSGNTMAIVLPDEELKNITERLHRLSCVLRDKMNISGRIALSEKVGDIRETHNAFYLVRHLLRLPHSAGEGEILRKENIVTPSFPIEFLDVSRLYELILHAEEDKAVAYVNNMFFELCRREYTDENDIQQIFFLYRRILIQIENDLKLEIDRGTVIPAYDSRLDVSSLFANIAESIRKICGIINSRHDERNIEFESSVLKFVDDNITNLNLYTRMVTSNFNILENRLQAIVRQWTGKSFLEYVESKRMALAREMILKTSKQISQIGRECGYSSENSFYKAFRRYYSQSPSEIRR